MTIKDAFQFGIEPVRITDTDNLQINEGLLGGLGLYSQWDRWFLTEKCE
ncbi:hypothetical protein K7A14_12955 [Escherichia coli]|nr:hypothetical protein [Escherichia coli]